MAVIRLFILVAVLGGLTLLLAQNFSPALPLVFLGVRTQPFPLAMWILFSVVAGAATSLVVSSLFSFTNYFAKTKPSLKSSGSSRAKSYRNGETGSRRESSSSSNQSSQSSQSSQYTNQYRDTSATEDDWDLNGQSDDWDFEDATPKSSTKSPQDKRISDKENYERQQEPRTTSKSDSSYSYSYREPKNSGVGKTESIYDADYRVIVPPYNPEPPSEPNPSPTPKPPKSDDDDDWSFFDEDEEK